MTDADPDALERHAARLDDAMARIAALDPTARAAAQDALDALNALHKDGLVTVVRRLREDDRGRELLYGLVDDPGVRMLLGMHGIIRPDPLTLARQALDQVRPGLQSHGGGRRAEPRRGFDRVRAPPRRLQRLLDGGGDDAQRRRGGAARGRARTARDRGAAQ
jgi:hypothetical protein